MTLAPEVILANELIATAAVVVDTSIPWLNLRRSIRLAFGPLEAAREQKLVDW